jgi:acyl carrier protein
LTPHAWGCRPSFIYERRIERRPSALHATMEDVIAILSEIRPGQNFSGVDDFFAQGLLDSLDLTALVAALESRYGVFMDVDEIVPDNFRNVAAIKTILSRHGVTP